LRAHPGLDEASFVGAPVDCLEQGQAGELVLALRPALLGGVGDDRDLRAVGVEQVERDLVDEPLQAQQRREVRLVGDAAAEAQQFVEGSGEQVALTPADPVAKRPVHLPNARVRRQRDIAARRIVVEIGEILRGRRLRQRREWPR
jgi:hypothetical protein